MQRLCKLCLQENDPEEQDETKFYTDNESGSDKESDESESSDDEKKKTKKYEMDPDLRLLLKNTKAMLQSRNSAVMIQLCTHFLFTNCRWYWQWRNYIII